MNIAPDHSTNIYGPLLFIISFANDHLTNIYGPLSYIFSLAGFLFDEKLGSLLIYFLYLHTTL